MTITQTIQSKASAAHGAVSGAVKEHGVIGAAKQAGAAVWRNPFGKAAVIAGGVILAAHVVGTVTKGRHARQEEQRQMAAAQGVIER